MNRADEVLLVIPSNVACKLWGTDKAPTNVLIQTEDGRTYNVCFSEAKGKIFFFNGNKTFYIKIETVDGKVDFTNGIDVIVSQLQLEAGCYLLFTNVLNFADVDVEEAVVAPIDSVHDVSPISVAAPAVAKQPHGRRYRFVRMVATYFRLPDNVSMMAKLDFGLKPITIRLLHRSLQKEFINGNRRENKDNGFRYALTSWSSFMKYVGIKVGDTVYYSF
ncbi:hypothetical protein Hanom_Chr11g01035171 [Helianthus anomalus]